MKNDNPLNYGMNILGFCFTAVQTDRLLSYISLALTILATIVSIAFTIYKWYNKAKADGKITKDEIDDLIDELSDNDKKEK